VIFDGALGALVDNTIAKEFIEDYDITLFIFGDVAVRSFLHSLFSIESDYWGIYFLVRLIKNWINGEYTSESDNLPIVT